MNQKTTILIAVCVLLTLPALAQKVSFSKKNATLKEIFAAIKKQTGYVFFYDEGLLTNTQKVNVSLTGQDVRQLLDLAFKGQHLVYTIENKTIFLKGAPDVNPSGAAPAQDAVSGRIVSKEGVPLTDISIQVKGQ